MAEFSFTPKPLVPDFADPAFWEDSQPTQQPSATPATETPDWHMPGAEYTAEEKDLLDVNYLEFIGTNSSLLGKQLETPREVILHVVKMNEANEQLELNRQQYRAEQEEGKRKRGRPAKSESEKALEEAQRRDRSNIYNAYIEACRKRKQEIAEAQNKLAELRIAKKRAIFEFDQAITEASKEYQELKNSAPPEQPTF